MQKNTIYIVWIALLLAVLLIMPLSACSNGNTNEAVGSGIQNEESGSSVQEEGPIGGGIKTAAIIFDFANGSPEENTRVETHYSYSEITDEEKIDALSDISGLDFYVTILEREERFVVDWVADSTLVAGLDDRAQKEDFHFYDADSLRWFMMDSLWRTLEREEIYYTMDGGKELAFDELYPVNAFPADLPYMGSAFYFAHADVIGDFSYIDEEHDLILNYPNVFAADPEEEDGVMMRFTSMQDNTVLQYWVIPNTYGDTPESFADSAPAEGIIIARDVVMGFGTDLDQLTGVETPTAYYWLVGQDRIACVAISCETMEQAAEWAVRMAEENAVSIVRAESEAGEIGIGEEEAMDMLVAALDMAEGTALVAYGEDIINGEPCWTFAYGKNTPEKFTAEERYAVTGDGTILVMDFLNNEYKEFINP